MEAVENETFHDPVFGLPYFRISEIQKSECANGAKCKFGPPKASGSALGKDGFGLIVLIDITSS